MAQNIDVRYRDRVLSEPFNQRIRDITGACILFGYRLALGTIPFSISLVRDNYPSSIAISQEGAKIEETADLIDVVSVAPNTNTSVPRMDGLYLVYVHGDPGAVAQYVVVPGLANTSTPADNPDPTTYLLLGYITVPPGSANLVTTSIQSVPYGFSQLRVAGKSEFFDDATFDKPVTFKSTVTFMDGSNDSSGGKAQLDRLPNVITATAGQTVVALPTGFTYTPNVKALFVFVDWILQPPGTFTEVDQTHFAFVDPLQGGEKIWAFWITNLAISQVTPHNHDESYYTKSQMDLRSVRYYQGYFVGMTGAPIAHNFGNLNYIVVSVVATNSTNDVGSISVSKQNNTVSIYNSGSYRGSFDLTLMQKY